MKTVKIIGLLACLYAVLVSSIFHIWFSATGWLVVGILMFFSFRYIEK